jgi:hypothetical protein
MSKRWFVQFHTDSKDVLKSNLLCKNRLYGWRRRNERRWRDERRLRDELAEVDVGATDGTENCVWDGDIPVSSLVEATWSTTSTNAGKGGGGGGFYFQWGGGIGGGGRMCICVCLIAVTNGDRHKSRLPYFLQYCYSVHIIFVVNFQV